MSSCINAATVPRGRVLVHKQVLSLCITNAYMVADLATLWIGAVREGKGGAPQALCMLVSV